jgi:uncharacterized protein (DUF433 family)
MDTNAFVTIDPEIQGGTPCFSGTRVPVKSMFDYLARGRTLDYFLQQFPSVPRETAVEVLRAAGHHFDPPVGANRQIA